MTTLDTPVDAVADAFSGAGPGAAVEAVDELTFLGFVEHAANEAHHRLPDLDHTSMQLVLTLSRIASAVTYDIESSVHRPAGWSWAGFRIMFALWVAGPREAKTVASLTGMSRAAVSNLLRTLIRDGYVARRTHPDDARAIEVRLTPSGAAQLVPVFAQHNAREAAWAAVLDDEEKSQLLSLLNKLSARGREPWVRQRD